ncbi:MAG: 30S ribosomal protein S6 [Patescibacteria group bacterium]
MEDVVQREQYELAFHIIPSFTDEQAEEKSREIEELVSKNGGAVSRYGGLKKMKLAYPIKKEQFSHFGYIEFFAPKNAVEKINKNLMLNDDLLRHIIIRKEEEKIAKPARMPKAKVEKPKAPAPETEEGEKKTEELDKKIEEILEKL